MNHREPADGAGGEPRRGISVAIAAMSRRSKGVALTTVFGTACVVELAGCGRATPAGSATVAAETFQPPSPEGAGNDPRVAGSGAAGDAISASLAVIHERLRDLDSAYRDKGRIEGDLKDVAERMRPLIAAARSDCDEIHRAATDLRSQLPIAQAGYASAAVSYRQRAEGYREPDLKTITLGVARRFDWLAADTPRRIALTERFLQELDDTRAFLAETERCLRDTETALAIFSGGAKLPPVSADGRAFSRRLGQFIAVVLEYEEKLLKTPPTTPQAGGAAEDPNQPASATPEAEASPPPDAASEEAREPEPASEAEPPPGGDVQKGFDSREQARALERIAWTSVRGEERWDPLPVGSFLNGEITASTHSYGNPVRLEVLERRGDAFSGVMRYEGGFAVGRRGVRGRVSPDGRLSFGADWYQGNLSPEAVAYELSPEGDGFAGTWRTGSLKGTIRLGRGPN